VISQTVSKGEQKDDTGKFVKANAPSMQFSRKSRSLRAACERGWAWEKGVDGCPGFVEERQNKNPKKDQISKKNENPEVTSRIETSRASWRATLLFSCASFSS